jgi:hypothetical protein
VATQSVTAHLGDKPVPARLEQDGETIRISWPERLGIGAGERLELRFS